MIYQYIQIFYGIVHIRNVVPEADIKGMDK